MKCEFTGAKASTAKDAKDAKEKQEVEPRRTPGYAESRGEMPEKTKERN
jgi:hypothetical protein